ncbi:cyclophilin-like fold protein [Cuneatibacter sp. NSJ-177]|uniref:cyclophilin-like fold protein n=1 Tax=Cuneatibacter sp. NSJ-177 TaxID=2931401 RepID=UPI001FD50F37|nr:cyclophilin-like fold protein [Cuneatibacter sp. NSJ-177]MCJ7835606.1 cyclophilin-like fold protein [Cuneatibacter sp. NSJ-177]
MKHLFVFAAGVCLILSLTACGSPEPSQEGAIHPPENIEAQAVTAPERTAGPEELSAQASKRTENSDEAEGRRKGNLRIGERMFTATLEENEAVNALVKRMEQAPVVVQMRDYSGFEKVGALEKSLPVSDSQITAQAGDIVLYNGDQIVLFYGSNTWSYTRIGKIDDLSGWEEALGSGDVTVTFSVE